MIELRHDKRTDKDRGEQSLPCTARFRSSASPLRARPPPPGRPSDSAEGLHKGWCPWTDRQGCPAPGARALASWQSRQRWGWVETQVVGPRVCAPNHTGLFVLSGLSAKSILNMEAEKCGVRCKYSLHRVSRT